MTAGPTTPNTVETYRDEIKRESPPWLATGYAEEYLYAFGLHIDIFGDAIVAAVKHRFPGLYSFEALGVIGRERRIARGRLESDATYADRLMRWLTDHRIRGGPYALLSQVAAHYAPDVFPMDLVYVSGRRFRITGLGATEIGQGTSIESVIERDDVAMHPDTDRARWARWWLFYYTDRWVDTPPTEAELADIRLVPQAWNAAHCIGTIILFPSTAELWNWPTDHTWNESGTWNVTGAGPTYIPVDPGVSVAAGTAHAAVNQGAST